MTATLKEILDYTNEDFDFYFFCGKVKVFDGPKSKPIYEGDVLEHAFLAIEAYKQTHIEGLYDEQHYA